MNEQERLRAEFDAAFLNDLAAAEAETQAAQPETNREPDSGFAGNELAELAPFTRAVVEQIRAIPEGRVMSYGQVAAEAGSPRGARQVVRILHSLSRKYDLPWHRVVNIRGEIALGEDGGGSEQQIRLEAEGVEFDLDGRIDMEQYRHQPSGST